ncbi:MAG: dipeptidase [Planctomycetota bacterium]|jgi:membrane dipeptidase
MDTIDNECLARARRLHQRAIVIDTHCDTTKCLMEVGWDLAGRHDKGHVDIPRLREGGIDAAFFAVFAPAAGEAGKDRAAAREQIRTVKRAIQHNPDQVTAAITADDVRGARSEGKIAVLVAIEGGHFIEDSLEILGEYRREGATYLTLTHVVHTTWADSCGIFEDLEPANGGLTAFGRDVVRELNRLGMMVDVSHVSDATIRDVLETSAAPIVATHSSCRAVSPHRRNLTDDMMREIAATGGIVQINFCSGFIDPDYPPPDPVTLREFLSTGKMPEHAMPDHITPLGVLVDHFDHALQLIGPEHVGIGSDFDGVDALPAGMEDCSKLPNLTTALLQRGYSEADLAKMLGENVLRVMDACSDVAGT